MSGSLRVLLTADSVGGVWQYALDLARALAPLGAEAVVAHLGSPPSAAQRAEAAGVRVIETGLPLDWLVDGPEPIIAAAQALAALARRERTDLMHVNMPTLAAAIRADVPVVAVAHGCVSTWWEAARPGVALDPAYAWHRRMTGEGLRAADAVVAPSAAHADAVARTYGLALGGRASNQLQPASPAEAGAQSPLSPQLGPGLRRGSAGMAEAGTCSRPIAVVHNGRTAHPLRAIEPVNAAFTAGRLWDAVKRTPLLDAVAARLPVPLRAAGAIVGPHGEAVRPDHLALLGSLDADGIAAELAAYPVFVSAAAFEPFGLAVLEAAQAGCALVLSDIPVFRELWDGAASFVAGDHPARWCAAVEALIAAPKARAALGKAARHRAARYTPAAMAAGMRAVYDAALAGRGVRERAA